MSRWSLATPHSAGEGGGKQRPAREKGTGRVLQPRPLIRGDREEGQDLTQRGVVPGAWTGDLQEQAPQGPRRVGPGGPRSRRTLWGGGRRGAPTSGKHGTVLILIHAPPKAAPVPPQGSTAGEGQSSRAPVAISGGEDRSSGARGSKSTWRARPGPVGQQVGAGGAQTLGAAPHPASRPKGRAGGQGAGGRREAGHLCPRGAVRWASPHPRPRQDTGPEESRS